MANIENIFLNSGFDLSPPPLVIGLQELKTTHFLTIVALNVIKLDYHRIISLPFEGRGGTPLLYHPSLQLADLGTMNKG